MKPRPVSALPRPPAQPEEQPLTALQAARRRQWVETLCANATNECSLALARKLCHRWFLECECIRHDNN